MRTAEQDTKVPEEVRVLIVFGGLPGVGKTTIARELARNIGAMYVRIDSIEQAIRDCQHSFAPVAPHNNEAGYRVAYAIAEDTFASAEQWSQTRLIRCQLLAMPGSKSGRTHKWKRLKSRLYVQILLNIDPAWKGDYQRFVD